MQRVNIEIPAGADWWIQFDYTLDGAAQALSSPIMEVRTAQNPTSALLFTSLGGSPSIIITIPQTGRLLCKIPGSASKGKPTQRGFWDCYATDGSGSRILIGSGQAYLSENVAAL